MLRKYSPHLTQLSICRMLFWRIHNSDIYCIYYSELHEWMVSLRIMSLQGLFCKKIKIIIMSCVLHVLEHTLNDLSVTKCAFSVSVFVSSWFPPRKPFLSSGKHIYIRTELLCVFIYVWFYSCFHSPGKGEDKEYPTIGARLIRLEDKVGTLLALGVCVFCL